MAYMAVYIESKMKLSEIKPNPNNPRIIKDEKFDKNSSLGQDFIQQAENKINELEKIRDNDDR